MMDASEANRKVYIAPYSLLVTSSIIGKSLLMKEESNLETLKRTHSRQENRQADVDMSDVISKGGAETGENMDVEYIL